MDVPSWDPEIGDTVWWVSPPGGGMLSGTYLGTVGPELWPLVRVNNEERAIVKSWLWEKSTGFIEHRIAEVLQQMEYTKVGLGRLHLLLESLQEMHEWESKWPGEGLQKLEKERGSK